MLEKTHTTISRKMLTRKVSTKGNHFNNFNTKCDKTNKNPYVCNECPNKIQCKKPNISSMLMMQMTIITQL